MNPLTLEQANKALGQSFRLKLDDETELDLMLTSVTPLRPTPPFPGKVREPFAMLFKGTAGRCCAQKTYLLRNDILGEQHVFLAPVGWEFQGSVEIYSYQAVFS